MSFLRCIQHTLGIVYNEKLSIEQIKQKILEEITMNIDFYEDCLAGKKDVNDSLEDIKTYFETNFFSSDIFEVLVTAALNVFRITIWIFQEDNENNFQTVRYLTDDEISQRRHVHILLNRDGDDPIGISNQYSSVLRRKYTDGMEYVDFGHETEVVEDNSPSTSLNRKKEMNRTVASSSSSTSGPPSPGNVETPIELLTQEGNENENEYQKEFDFSDEPDASKYNARNEEERTTFPEHIFQDIQPEAVTFVPYNITGNHSYRIQVPSKKWHKYQDDGRWFRMNTSTMRKRRIVRKTGKCFGSFTCRNDRCPKYTSGKGRNTYAFTSVGLNLMECKTCGDIAERDFCGALKLTKFHPEKSLLEVFYAGTHSCNLKVRTPYSNISRSTKKYVLKPILQKNPKATIKEISEEAAESFLRMGNPTMAKEAVRLAQDKRFVAEMREEVLKLICDKDPNSFKSIDHLRENLKEYDPFFIYKLNDGSSNDEVSYVFKSSKCAAELAIEMDCDDPDNKSCLRDEPVYCDTMHSRVDRYKNVTAWVKNPITRSMMWIATMEVQNENTHTLELFFKLLNEILQKVTGNPHYKFNPYRFYVDEAGANINAISRVFGRKGLERILGCQWHFLRSAQSKAKFVEVTKQESFIHLARRMVLAPTRDEYEAASRCLRAICEDNNLLDWFDWWDERRFHIVPAYRGFNLSGTNLAESGQSGMKPKTRKKMKLVDAAYKDVSAMMRQDEQYRAYIGNISKEIGRGLNIRQIEERERRSQEFRAKRYAEALLSGDVNALTDDEDEENIPFVPMDRARHRPPKIQSKNNPTEKKQNVGKGKGKGKGKKTVHFYEIHSSDSDASSIHEEETSEVPEFIDADYLNSVGATKLITLESAIRVKSCYTCKEPFNRERMVPPYNFIFSRKTKRLRPDGNGGQIRGKTPTSAFFCARDMACLEVEFPNVKKENIYMGNLTFHCLTHSQKKFLKLKGYWDPIVHNRRLKSSFQ